MDPIAKANLLRIEGSPPNNKVNPTIVIATINVFEPSRTTPILLDLQLISIMSEYAQRPILI